MNYSIVFCIKMSNEFDINIILYIKTKGIYLIFVDYKTIFWWCSEAGILFKIKINIYLNYSLNSIIIFKKMYNLT